MTRCIIVDDEPIAVRVLSSLLGRIPDVEVVATCTNAVEALQAVNASDIDLVFLDIEMPELTGIDFVESLIEPPHFIFTTAHRNYAVRGFDLDAVDYLLKPIALPRLLRALDKYRRLSSCTPDHSPTDPGLQADVISFKVDRRTVRLDPAEIRYIESLSDYCVIHTDHKPYTARLRISDLEERLAAHGFLRIHRSYLVPIQRVEAYTSREVQIDSRVLPVSRTYRKQVYRLLESR